MDSLYMKMKAIALSILFFLQSSLCHADPDFISMAIDESGNAWTAAQVSVSNNPPIIRLAYQPFGSALQTPITISNPSFASQDPVLLMNKAGDAAVCWLSYDSINNVMAVYASTLQANQTWTTAERLSLTTQNILTNHKCELLITDTGKAVVFWLAYDDIAGVVRLYSSNLDIGQSGSTRTTHSDSDENVTKAYNILTTCTGNIVVSWNSYVYAGNLFVNSIQSGDIHGNWNTKTRFTLLD